MRICNDRNMRKCFTETNRMAARVSGTQRNCTLHFFFPKSFKSCSPVYLFEQRVSADFLGLDLTGGKLPHILIHDRLQVHGTVQTTLQFPKQRRQSPRQESCLSTTACRSQFEIYGAANTIIIT